MAEHQSTPVGMASPHLVADSSDQSSQVNIICSTETLGCGRPRFSGIIRDGLCEWAGVNQQPGDSPQVVVTRSDVVSSSGFSVLPFGHRGSSDDGRTDNLPLTSAGRISKFLGSPDIPPSMVSSGSERASRLTKCRPGGGRSTTETKSCRSHQPASGDADALLRIGRFPMRQSSLGCGNGTARTPNCQFGPDGKSANLPQKFPIQPPYEQRGWPQQEHKVPEQRVPAPEPSMFGLASDNEEWYSQREHQALHSSPQREQPAAYFPRLRATADETCFRSLVSARSRSNPTKPPESPGPGIGVHPIPSNDSAGQTAEFDVPRSRLAVATDEELHGYFVDSCNPQMGGDDVYLPRPDVAASSACDLRSRPDCGTSGSSGASLATGLPVCRLAVGPGLRDKGDELGGDEAEDEDEDEDSEKGSIYSANRIESWLRQEGDVRMGCFFQPEASKRLTRKGHRSRTLPHFKELPPPAVSGICRPSTTAGPSDFYETACEEETCRQQKGRGCRRILGAERFSTNSDDGLKGCITTPQDEMHHVFTPVFEASRPDPSQLQDPVGDRHAQYPPPNQQAVMSHGGLRLPQQQAIRRTHRRTTASSDTSRYSPTTIVVPPGRLVPSVPEEIPSGYSQQQQNRKHAQLPPYPVFQPLSPALTENGLDRCPMRGSQRPRLVGGVVRRRRPQPRTVNVNVVTAGAQGYPIHDPSVPLSSHAGLNEWGRNQMVAAQKVRDHEGDDIFEEDEQLDTLDHPQQNRRRRHLHTHAWSGAGQPSGMAKGGMRSRIVANGPRTRMGPPQLVNHGYGAVRSQHNRKTLFGPKMIANEAPPTASVYGIPEVHTSGNSVAEASPRFGIYTEWCDEGSVFALPCEPDGRPLVPQIYDRESQDQVVSFANISFSGAPTQSGLRRRKFGGPGAAVVGMGDEAARTRKSPGRRMGILVGVAFAVLGIVLGGELTGYSNYSRRFQPKPIFHARH